MDVSRAAQRTIESTAVLPSGIVTFLFTDIEGSTQMLERHRAAAGPALARHHDLLLGAVEAANGVVFETVGDAVYAAFTRPTDAVAAAVAIQLAMAAEDWGEIGDLRVRIAVHSGAVEARGRHYFGPALFEGARLQSLAHGGQTLTSAATHALASADLTDGISFRPMGTHRLKDLLESLDVYQVVAPGLTDRFPPLRAATEAPTNLATDPTAFIGRVADMAALEALLDEHRFVTLVGPGGTGKTRLAVESGLRRLDSFPDGAWIAELAPITDPDVVSPAIADIWSLRSINRSDLDDVIDRHLAPRQLLLIIDNCEHLLDAVAPMVERMMRAAPGLSVIATSREPLGIAGESVYRVPSLSLPDEADDPGSSESVRLFVDRARLVRPDFSPGDDELGPCSGSAAESTGCHSHWSWLRHVCARSLHRSSRIAWSARSTSSPAARGRHSRASAPSMRPSTGPTRCCRSANARYSGAWPRSPVDSTSRLQRRSVPAGAWMPARPSMCSTRSS